MSLDLIIKNGIIVTASDEYKADIGVRDGKIIVISAELPVPDGCEVIDADGGFVTVSEVTPKLYSGFMH